MQASTPLHPGSIKTPNPPEMFRSTLPATATEKSNKATKAAQQKATRALRGNTTCCSTTHRALMPKREN